LPRIRKLPKPPMPGEDPLSQRLGSEQSSTLQFPEDPTRSKILPIDSGGPRPEETVNKGAQISDLRVRYNAGEGPNDDKNKGREQIKKTKTKKEELEQAERFDNFAGQLNLVAQVAGTLLCEQLPNPLPPSPLEVEALDKALTGVAKKHFDKMLEYDAEASLFLALLVITLPRLKRAKKPETPEETLGRNMNESVEAARKLEAELEAEKNKKSLEVPVGA
jgi:hypothetical protein